MTLSWKAEDILRIIHGQSLHEQNWVANGISIDSRTTSTGDLFIAIKGDAHDGHDHVSAAFAAGAVAAIVHKTPSQVSPDAPLLTVEDTFKALQDLGRAGRQRAKGKIFAVTGSVGKTSSKEQLRLALEACGSTHANEGSLNNHWGVPLSLARFPEDSTYGVFEIGMNHKGELAPLSREVQPHVSLITNIEAVHLEYFESVEEIADAKAEIFDGMTSQGIVVLNRDNAHFARLATAAKTKGIKQILSFGRDPKSEGRLLNWTATEEGGQIEAVIMGQPVSYRLSAPGQHFAINSVGALLTAVAGGADLYTAAEALIAFRPPYGRGTRHQVKLPEGGSFTVIDETFNASPVSTRAAIHVLAAMNLQNDGTTKGRRVVALGDMRELGASAPFLHAGLAEDLSQAGIDCVHCCGTMMANLYEALPEKMRGHHAASSEELAPLVAADARTGDIILVKGSKSMLMPKVVAALKARHTHHCDHHGSSSHKIAS